MKNRLTLGLLFVLSMSFWLFMPGLPLAQNKDTSHQVQKNPDEAANNYYLKTAMGYFAAQDYTKAAEAAELAILLDPGCAEAQTLLHESQRLQDAKKQTGGTQAPKEPAAPSSPEAEIPSLLEDARIAIREARFDEAQALLYSILKTDPLNKNALYLKGTMNDLKHGRVTESLKTTGSQEKHRTDEHLRESIIPYQDILRYPAEVQWKDIANRKLPELNKIVEESKKTTDKLRLISNPSKESASKVIDDALNTIISFEFVDTPLKDVVAFVREKTNTNMIVDAEAGGAQINLKLNNVPLKTAFRYLLPKGYEYVIEGDIFHIYRQKMELRVYDVRDILINLDDKEPLMFDITAAATSQQAISRGAPVHVKDAAERVMDLIEQITTTVEPSSWSSNLGVIGIPAAIIQRRINVPGQGTGSIVARMGQPGDLVVVNSKSVHEQIEIFLASVRSSQNLQVSIEARFITVTDKFLEDIGNNFLKFSSQNLSGIVDTGGSSVGGNLSGKDITGLNLQYSIFGNDALVGLLRAVQESKGSEILNSPRITLCNTQRGNIAVVKTINYVQSTSVKDGVVTPVIGTLPEGTTFDVRPVVGADRKYIYLEVTPSVFDVEEPIPSFKFSGVGTGTTIGGATGGTTVIPPDQTVQLPQVNISQVSVTVCVPDKGTLMIGGMGAINKDVLTSGIPILSKIPILKTLFSRNRKTSEKKNLIILLRPTILIKEEQEGRFLGQSNNTSAVKDLPNDIGDTIQR
ncbi:MAG: xpsD [Candidatus Brocadiaceae bacterium]|nr:xpsD [Candidatus Brocadiaceae bacterium]